MAPMMRKVVPSFTLLLLSLFPGLVTGQGDTAEQITLRYTITEGLGAGSIIGNVFSDAFLDHKYSSLDLKSLEFTFLNDPVLPLDVNMFTGQIQTAGQIDRDEICPGLLDCCQKMDVVVKPIYEIIKVSIQIEDLNDNEPAFLEENFVHDMIESADLGTDIVLPLAVDTDSGVFGIQRYELQPASDVFKLVVKGKLDGSKDVRLVLVSQLDRETKTVYQMKIVASDGGNPSKSGSMDITIQVQDANDNDPEFEESSYEVTIEENIAVLTPIVQVGATDADSGNYGEVLYRFSEQTQNDFGHMFGIVNTSGEIYISGVIDYEEGSVYHLTVMAQDRGPDSVPSDTTVIVHVTDVNDNSPKITVNALNSEQEGVAEVPEHSSLGTFVGHISVQDPDEGKDGEFKCTLDTVEFKLQKLNIGEYKIVTNKQVNREQKSTYSFTINCEDKGDEPQKSSKVIQVNIGDINDNHPVFGQNVYPGYIAENNFEGMYITSVTATDADIGLNGEVEYRMDDTGKEHFLINPNTGSITAKRIFDREVIQQVKFQVFAVDKGVPQMTGSASVVVRVTDLNDEKPIFTQPAYSFGIYENSKNLTGVGVVTAVDRDEEPYNKFVYSLLASDSAIGKFTIVPHTGRIFSLTSLDREAVSVYYLTVVAADIVLPHMSSTAPVTVHVNDRNDNSPVIDYPSELNNTIHVSNQAPSGFLITKVKAHDLDIDINANLTYEIVKGNRDNTFLLDPRSGNLYLNQRIYEQELFELQLQVSDHGLPARHSVVDFNIVVNNSLAYSYQTGQGILQGSNFAIAVTLVCVSLFIMVVLTIAIVLIKRQGRKNKNMGKYNSRMEALKMLHSSMDCAKGENNVSSQTAPNFHQSPPEGSTYQAGELCEDVERGCCVQDGDKTVSLWLSTIQPQDSKEHGSVTLNHSIDHVAPPSGENQPLGCPVSHTTRTLTQSEIQVHQLLEKLKGDSDADSAYSAPSSSSSPDSGHGPSEEGEAALHQHLYLLDKPRCGSHCSLRAPRCFINNSLTASPRYPGKPESRCPTPPTELTRSCSTLSLHTFAHTNAASGQEERLARQAKSAAYRSLRLHRMTQDRPVSFHNSPNRNCVQQERVHSSSRTQSQEICYTQGYVSGSAADLLAALRASAAQPIRTDISAAQQNNQTVDPEELCKQLKDHFRLDTFV